MYKKFWFFFLGSFWEASEYLELRRLQSYKSESSHLPDKSHEKSNNPSWTSCGRKYFCRLIIKELIYLTIRIILKCKSARKIPIPEIFHHGRSVHPPYWKYPDELISFRNKLLHSFRHIIFYYMTRIDKWNIFLEIRSITEIEDMGSIPRFLDFFFIGICNNMSEAIRSWMGFDDKWVHRNDMKSVKIEFLNFSEVYSSLLRGRVIRVFFSFLGFR